MVLATRLLKLSGHHAGQMQRCACITVLRLERCASLDQRYDGVQMALTAGIVQQRQSHAIGSTQICSAIDEVPQRLRIFVVMRR